MPGYFHTLGIPVKSGRDFSAADNTPGSPYRFIVNEEFVRQFLNGGQPLGKRINAVMDTTNFFGEIIGVATVYYVHSHLKFPA